MSQTVVTARRIFVSNFEVWKIELFTQCLIHVIGHFSRLRRLNFSLAHTARFLTSAHSLFDAEYVLCTYLHTTCSCVSMCACVYMLCVCVFMCRCAELCLGFVCVCALAFVFDSAWSVDVVVVILAGDAVVIVVAVTVVSSDCRQDI